MKSAIPGACGLLVALLSGAQAADYYPPRPNPYAAPYAAPYYNWAGIYIGANAGYARSNSSSSLSVAGLGLSVPTDMDGAIGGVQIGANWHNGRFLLGLEADIQATSQRDTHSVSAFGASATLTNTIPWLATFRGRAGVTLDQWLFYGTGGLALTTIESEGTATFAGTTRSLSVVQPQAAWTVGAGIETALWNSNWTAKIEYLYIDSIDVSTNVLGIVDMRSNASDSIVRVGVNYRFGNP